MYSMDMQNACSSDEVIALVGVVRLSLDFEAWLVRCGSGIEVAGS